MDTKKYSEGLKRINAFVNDVWRLLIREFFFRKLTDREILKYSETESALREKYKDGQFFLDVLVACQKEVERQVNNY